MTDHHRTDPVSQIFLSCDLTGSTDFKQRDHNSSDPWQKIFLQFYREFPQTLAMTQQGRGIPDLSFRLWKPIGDELIYTCVVRSEQDVFNAVRTWIEAMRTYERDSLSERGMGTKGGAFIATFPGPDSRSSVPRDPGTEDSDADVIDLNRAALEDENHEKYLYDYFGPSIDTGFRVLGKCTPRYFTLSVEVAFALSCLAQIPGPSSANFKTEDLVLLDLATLKGVWQGRSYPVFAIDSQFDDAFNRAYAAFDKPPSMTAIAELCQACYSSEGWPSLAYLPRASSKYFADLPQDPLADYATTSSEGAETLPSDNVHGVDLAPEPPLE